VPIGIEWHGADGTEGGKGILHCHSGTATGVYGIRFSVFHHLLLLVLHDFFFPYPQRHFAGVGWGHFTHIGAYLFFRRGFELGYLL